MASSSLDFYLSTTVAEKTKSSGDHLWAVSVSDLCADGSFLFATAGGPRIIIYIALASGGIDVIEVSGLVPKSPIGTLEGNR